MTPRSMGLTPLPFCDECNRLERIATSLDEQLKKARWERDAAVCKAGKLQNTLDEIARGSNLGARLLKAHAEIERLEQRVRDLLEGLE